MTLRRSGFDSNWAGHRLQASSGQLTWPTLPVTGAYLAERTLAQDNGGYLRHSSCDGQTALAVPE